ncbi:MAG: hypothetical protein KC419_27140 [Anaerolineales bacterium]|nr:hypothetical protein [Anaerolineales bacterium]
MILNFDLLRSFGTAYLGRSERATGLMASLSMLEMFHGLVALYPTSSTNASGQLVDKSGNNNHLTPNSGPELRNVGSIPTAHFSGAGSSQNYQDAASSTDFAITGTETFHPTSLRGLTIGCWFRPTDLQIGAGNRFLLGKYEAATSNRSYGLRQNEDDISFVVYKNTTDFLSLPLYSVVTVNTWQLFIARFKTQNNELKLWTKDTEDTLTDATYSSINNSTAAFTVGSRTDAAGEFDGHISLAFVCNAAVPDAAILAYRAFSKALFK